MRTTNVLFDFKFLVVPNGAVDWRKEAGVATKVKNQGQCGSCWAFSTIGAVEAYYAKVKGQKNLDLSEQQIVDCSKSGNQGCNGGWPRVALQWVAQHGVTTQAAYPYVFHHL
jgi:C1A family cysteine protease